jgi:hypothetical protein
MFPAELSQRSSKMEDIMDILTVVVIFLILEAGICGLCCYVCRERQVSSETEKSKKTSHHSAAHSPRLAHGLDHQKTWSRAADQQLKGHDNNIHLTCFRPDILP